MGGYNGDVRRTIAPTFRNSFPFDAKQISTLAFLRSILALVGFLIEKIWAAKIRYRAGGRSLPGLAFDRRVSGHSTTGVRWRGRTDATRAVLFFFLIFSLSKKKPEKRVMLRLCAHGGLAAGRVS